MSGLLTNALLSLPLVGAYAMFALGIVVIYRASNVLNLAHGAMAALPAYIAYALVEAGLPIWVGLFAAIISGAVLGLLIELLVMRPLRDASDTTQTVGTVAILGILLAVVARIWGTAPLRAPDVFPVGGIPVGQTEISYGEIGLLVVSVFVGIGFTFIFQRTSLGLIMRGAADNARAAVLMGVNPDQTGRVAWAMGGGLAALAGVLLAAATSLHPYTLSRQVLPAFVAALIGGLSSLAGAIIGSLVVGLVQGIVSSIGPLADQAGSPQLALAVLALVVMAVRGRQFSVAASGGARATSGMPQKRMRMTKLKLAAGAAILPALVAWPYLPVPPWLLANANLAAIFTVIGVSLVVLTGWVGQISLAQGAFVGISAFTTGLLVREAGIPFPLNLPLAAAAAAAVAAALGFVALRVRGLYLAVATLIFGWMTDEYLFKSSWLVGEGGSSTITQSVIGKPGAIPAFDLTDRRVFWFVALAAALIALAAAANLRDSKIGRALFAVRGSEMAAASLGIDVTKTKLAAFMVSGTLAGIAGNLIMIDQKTATPSQFSFTASLFFLSMAVVGGIGRLSGAVGAAIFFALLTGLSESVPALGIYLEIATALLLLGAVMTTGRGSAWIPKLRRKPSTPRTLDLPKPDELSSDEDVLIPESAPARGKVLELKGVTVRFGGLRAAHDVSLEINAGEIVGLIGPNGAGKTTVFNAISGFVKPTEGSVELFGSDVSELPVHARSALGLARTFQALQMFPEASVFDNLLVASHLNMKTNLASHLFVTDNAVKAERQARETVTQVLDLVGLTEMAHLRAGDLPFGTLRIVDVARALVTQAPFIILDEPASGLDNRETESLAELLMKMRSEMNKTLLVVEHDVAFVTSISDRIYVLERGEIIASGSSEQIRSDPIVIAAYLGTHGQEVDEDVLEPAG